MSLPLLSLLPLIIQKLQVALGPHKPLHAVANALRLTIEGSTFRLVPLGAFRGQPPEGPGRPAAPAPDLPSIAVAEYIPSQVGQELRRQGQYYADAMGNFWVEGHPQALLLFSSGARHRRLPRTQGAAFGVQGLRLLVHLLHDPQLVRRPAAELARHARVPTLAVAAALADLRAEGFLLADPPRLVHLLPLAVRWAAAYRTTLRPQLPTQRYRWQASCQARPAWVALARKTHSLLGGGLAARRLLASPLAPATVVLYAHTPATAALLLKAGLEPHKDGPVEVTRLFAVPLVFPHDYCIHPLFIYADLLGSEEPGSHLAARQLLARYLPHLEK